MTDGRERFLGEFQRFRAAHARGVPPGVARLREAAGARFVDLGFPTPRLEEWRFTNVAPIAETDFALAVDGAAAVSAAAIERLGFGDRGIRLVVVNGQFAPHLSSLPRTRGVEAGSLADAVGDGAADIERYLGRLARPEVAFTALNTAFLHDGAYLRVAPGTVVEEPVQIVFLSSPGNRPTISHPRVLTIVGENSHLTLVESYGAVGDGIYCTNAVTEIAAGPNAVVDHYKLLRESFQGYHIATIQVRVERSAAFTSHNITLGGALVRNDSNAVLDGEGIDCTLNGLYLVDGRRLVDNHTLIDHAQPHCTSHELYKGILAGQARAVFNGKIIVRPDAQKTDAKQTNKALLLSENAQINTKPQLEIFADDVKCTHGATVGQLDPDAMFYLRARGLGAARARSMLIHAFAADILMRFKMPAIRTQLEAVMLEQLRLSAEDEVCYAQPD